MRERGSQRWPRRSARPRQPCLRDHGRSLATWWRLPSTGRTVSGSERKVSVEPREFRWAFAVGFGLYRVCKARSSCAFAIYWTSRIRGISERPRDRPRERSRRRILGQSAPIAEQIAAGMRPTHRRRRSAKVLTTDPNTYIRMRSRTAKKRSSFSRTSLLFRYPRELEC
jgi:hypothetical protein